MCLIDSEKTKALKDLSKISDCLWYKTIGSTNDDIKQIVKSKLKDDVIVRVADYQTRGRGTHGREWVSEEKALLMSVGVKLDVALSSISGITLVIGGAIVRLLRVIGENVYLKWPNDIFLKEKKLGGILTEIAKSYDNKNVLIIGIGLNIRTKNSNHACFQKVAEYIDIIELASNITKIIVAEVRGFDKLSMKKLQQKWPEYDFCKDKIVEIVSDDGVSFSGIVDSITDKGHLKVINTDTKEVKIFHTATVREKVRN